MPSEPYFQTISYDKNLDDLDEKENELSEEMDAEEEEEWEKNILPKEGEEEVEEVEGEGDDDEGEEGEAEDWHMEGGGPKEIKQVDMQLDEEDGDEGEEEGLQKFNETFRKNFIETYHPEIIIPNSEEIMAMVSVTRDEHGNIIDDLHTTYPFMSKYIYTKSIAKRSRQLEGGARPLIAIPENIIDPRLIAEREMEANVIPFIIKRTLPNGGSEYWHLRDLEKISF